MSRVRPKAVCVFRREGRVLVSRLRDPATGGWFYCPLGGEIEFGERAEQAVRREVREELGADVADLTLLGVLENLFTYGGRPGHEIVFVFDGRFADPGVYDRAELAGVESGGEPFAAVWISPDRADLPLFPAGLSGLLAASG